MLDGKKTVITGAGRNVGRGIAKVFAEHGASVAVNDIDEERCENTVDNLATPNGQQHLSLAGDGTNSKTIKEFANTVKEKFGEVDVLVNNLGYAVNKSIFDTSEKSGTT